MIPAIDVRGGRTVRLLRGDFERETVYGDDPIATAQHWQRQGTELVHVVDLDGAKAGSPQQTALVARIAQVVPVQVGGGLRADEDLARVAPQCRRLVIGSAALDIEFVGRAVKQYGDRVVVALDARNDVVAVDGWTRTSDRRVLDLARALIDAGVGRLLHTDVERDGTLTAPNYHALEALIALGAPVLASGGVSSLHDLCRLRDIGAEGAIVGRALYEGEIEFGEAVAVAR